MTKQNKPLDPFGLWDDPKNVGRLLSMFYVICAILFLVDFVVHRHMIHPWEHMWGFYAIFGWIACVILVLVAKELRKALMRGEDFYDR